MPESDPEIVAQEQGMSDEEWAAMLRGINASYDQQSRTFSVTNISAKDAHTLIWRGGAVVDAIIVAIRQALVVPQDHMPEDHYTQAVDEADADEKAARHA